MVSLFHRATINKHSTTSPLSDDREGIFFTEFSAHLRHNTLSIVLNFLESLLLRTFAAVEVDS